MIPRQPHIPNPTTTYQYLLALYIHVPFCRTRCTYCAFNTYTGQSGHIPAYLDALRREVNLVTGQDRPPAHTIYFGGGTPSLLLAEQVGALLRHYAARFTLAPDTEITLEANPGTVDQPYLNKLRQAGVNRLSVGMQSAHERELKLFGRRHHLEHVSATVRMARAAGFDNISLDLIYGVPDQTLAMWQASIQTALRLQPDHLSLYSLGLEEGTPLYRSVIEGQLADPDPDLAADMYEWASDYLAAQGFEQYEISNWARPGATCRHNVHVWRNQPYLGFGAGAHGYSNATRYANVDHPQAYIERIQAQPEPLRFPLSAAAETVESVDQQQHMSDMMLMGLRLTRDGITADDFHAQCGRNLWDAFGAELNRLIGTGLLEHTTDGHIRLTQRARLISNQVFMAFV
ncbi:MAG: radical SAM family heme chaperone HemW [Anaerolineae bacterium]|nr:radical SAM family heme chaperone HemW [Anaerolineae bacterium]